jgi:hypothetical protein
MIESKNIQAGVLANFGSSNAMQRISMPRAAAYIHYMSEEFLY